MFGKKWWRNWFVDFHLNTKIATKPVQQIAWPPQRGLSNLRAAAKQFPTGFQKRGAVPLNSRVWFTKKGELYVYIYIYCIYDVTCELMGVISACFYPLTTSAASSDHHFPYTSNSSSDGFGVEGSDQSKAHRFGPILGYQWCLPITSSGKCSLQIACVHRICYCEKPAFSKLFHVGVLSNQWSLLQTILDAHKPSTEEHIGRSSLLLFSAKLIIKDKQDHCK